MNVRSVIAALPPEHVHHGYLYAVEFADGTVKVGASNSIRSRVRGLVAFGRRHGINATAAYAVRFRGNLRRAEDRAISRMNQAHGPASYGREWFSGAHIDDAIRAIEA